MADTFASNHIALLAESLPPVIGWWCVMATQLKRPQRGFPRRSWAMTLNRNALALQLGLEVAP